MTCHISEGACAEIEVAAPIEGVIGTLFVRPLRCRTKPAIPVERLGNRIGALGALNALRPDGPVGPHMQFEGLANDTSLDDFDGAAQAVARAALVAHLRGYFGLFG